MLFFFFWLPTVSSELENTLKRKIEIHFSLFPEGSYRSAGETNHTNCNTQREGNSITLTFKKYPLNCPFYTPTALPT